MTASVVAFDEEAGEIGAAVVAPWPNAGALVPFARAGVGVVVVQGAPDAAYGALGLELMAGGLPADDALRALLAVDGLPARRQVALLDADGGAAVHTGASCVPESMHASCGSAAAVSTMLARPIAHEMLEGFRAATGDLAGRLVAALQIARGAEGEMPSLPRSAALIVVGSTPTTRPWDEVRFDLRVDLHDDPVEHLARLLALKRAVRRMHEATGEAMLGDPDRALAMFGDVDVEQSPYLDFAARKAMLLARAGRMDDARALCRRLQEDGPGWQALFRRWEQAGMLPEDLVDALFPT